MGVRLIQVPYDSGYRDRRMGLGPARLIEGGAAARLAEQGGPVEMVVVEWGEPFALEIALAFELQRQVAAQVRRAVLDGDFPLVFAGNCNATLGALAGLHMPEKPRAGRPGLVWFDSHGDFNTPETSRSGFLDGMAISMITGDCWRAATDTVEGFQPLEENLIALCGARDFDDAERERLEASAIRQVDCKGIQEKGALAALSEVLDDWSGRTDGIYVHVDLDVHDPTVAPFNTYQAPGGLTGNQVRACLRAIGDRTPIVGCTFSAFDPACDPDRRALATALELLQTLAEQIAGR